MNYNESRRNGILRLKHLREVNEATAEEMDEHRARFQRLADPASAPTVVTARQLFQTPPIIAAQVAGMAVRPDGSFGRTLEPSAGLGRIYHAVKAIDAACLITLVDVSPDCCGVLYRATEFDRYASLKQSDFLSLTADDLGTFDTIVMNPPFERGADIRHIEHAYRLLNPGGVLVSVLAQSERRRSAFYNRSVSWINLPSGSFKSEGTGVETAIVKLRR